MYFAILLIFLPLLCIGEITNVSTSLNAPEAVSPAEKRKGQSHVAYADKCDDTQGSLSLNLRNVGLQHIDSDFANSPNVTCLSLEDNGIADVSSTAFQLMPNLVYLNLARNKLDIGIFARRLEGHAHLRVLVLDENAFPASAANASLSFANEFPRLSYLYLREIGIEDLSSLSFAPRLMRLYLSSNKLAKSDLSFLSRGVPASLETLDLASNGLREFNASSLKSVRDLILDGNQIGRLCGKCWDSSALVLEGASLLRRLSVSRNALIGIEPDAFDDSEYLLDLDLSHNRIDSIRKNTFERTSMLRNLSLKANLLSEMPDFYGSEALVYLSLADNLIEAVNNESFADLFKLRMIDLSNNRIGSLEAGAFAKLHLLEVLDLSNNRLTSFPNTWLYDLTYLKQLYINGNRLRTLNDVKFHGMRSYGKLERIYLQNNSITEIRAGFLYNGGFKNIPNVTLVLFDDPSPSGPQHISATNDSCKCNCDEINEISDFVSRSL